MKWLISLFVIASSQLMAAERVVLAPGGTTLLSCPKVEHVALGNEQVVSVQETLPGKLLVSAKTPGATKLWCLKGSKETVFDVVVTGISALSPTRYRLDILVAEITRSASRSIGVDTSINGSLSLSGRGESRGLNPSTDDAAGLLSLDLFAELALLERQGQAEVWSKGEIRIESGSETTLLAGGEIPIPGGEQSTEFRPYGLDLGMRARSIDLNTVELDLKVSLTALDYGVAINGVPGLTNRDISTKRQYRLGESVVLARIERGERGSNDSGLPAVTTKNERLEEERELWVLIRPRAEEQIMPQAVSKTPMAGSRGVMGVYE